MKTILTLVTLSAIPFAPALSQSPFGLQLGASKSQVERVVTLEETNEKGKYLVLDVPNGSSKFEFYVLGITPTHGLCVITAVGVDIRMDSYGSTVISEFQEMVQNITDRYGEPFGTVDQLKSGSIWTEPNEWAMALYQKERELLAGWFELEGAVPSNLTSRDAVGAIAVGAQALSSSTAYITVEFVSQQYEECIEEIRKMNNPF